MVFALTLVWHQSRWCICSQHELFLGTHIWPLWPINLEVWLMMVSIMLRLCHTHTATATTSGKLLFFEGDGNVWSWPNNVWSPNICLASLENKCGHSVIHIVVLLRCINLLASTMTITNALHNVFACLDHCNTIHLHISIEKVVDFA